MRLQIQLRSSFNRRRGETIVVHRTLEKVVDTVGGDFGRGGAGVATAMTTTVVQGKTLGLVLVTHPNTKPVTTRVSRRQSTPHTCLATANAQRHLATHFSNALGPQTISRAGCSPGTRITM